MKVSLEGLARNAACALEPGGQQRKLYAFSLRELAAHVEGVQHGKYTLTEFCDHYCLTPEAEPTWTYEVPTEPGYYWSRISNPEGGWFEPYPLQMEPVFIDTEVLGYYDFDETPYGPEPLAHRQFHPIRITLAGYQPSSERGRIGG